MLLPTELDTAMSPNPLRATITEVIKSGMDVPAARKVRPMTYSKKRKRKTGHTGLISGAEASSPHKEIFLLKTNGKYAIHIW